MTIYEPDQIIAVESENGHRFLATVLNFSPCEIVLQGEGDDPEDAFALERCPVHAADETKWFDTGGDEFKLSDEIL